MRRAEHRCHFSGTLSRPATVPWAVDLAGQVLGPEAFALGDLGEPVVDLQAELAVERALRSKTSANSGSMPDEQPAMMLIVPGRGDRGHRRVALRPAVA